MLNNKVVLITGGTGSFGKKFVEVKVDATFEPALMDEAAYEAFAKENGISYKKYPTKELWQEKGFMNYSKL